MTVGGVKWVGAAFRFSFDFRNISVVIGSETAGVTPGFMSLLSACACNVIDFHHVTSFSASHNVSLGSCLVDIIDIHSITNKLRRRSWANFNLWKLVVRVQWVVTGSLRLEFNDLWGGERQVTRLEVSLIFVESNVEGTRSRSIDIPVIVSELLLVNFL